MVAEETKIKWIFCSETGLVMKLKNEHYAVQNCYERKRNHLANVSNAMKRLLRDQLNGERDVR